MKVSSTAALGRSHNARREIAGALAFSPVPRAACEYLDNLLTGRYRNERFHLAFKVVSHLLGNGGEHYITQAGFEAMGASSDHSYQAKQVRLLLDAGIIELVRDASWHGADKTARVFRIPDHLFNTMLSDPVTGAHATPATFRSWNFHKAKPYTTLHQSIRDQAAEEPEVASAILNLQGHSIGFDRLGFLAGLRQDRAGMSPKDFRKRASFAVGVADGANFTEYRLAKSGRVLSMSPNLQGIPRAMRGPWFFPQVGHTWLDFDFRSQEPWIVAHLSGDESLMKALYQGLYELVVAKFGLDRNSQVKPMVNAFFYGARVKALARAAFGRDKWEEPTQDEIALADELQAFMMASFPKAYKWMDRTAAEVRRTGRAESVGGFVREGIPWQKAWTVGPNHVVQGTGADILRVILQVLDRELGSLGYVLLPMHDGLLVESAAAVAEVVGEIVKRTMRDAVSLFLPGLVIPVETIAGWRDKNEPLTIWNQRPARFGRQDLAA